nr:zinc finger, CCHC-type [Tanacetum cinerariifolium]
MARNTVKEITTNFGKLDKFEGHDFRRWQKKMHFLLTTLKVVYVLTTPMLELLEDATVEVIRIRAKWENDDYICRGHILNGMSDSLFDVYTNVESAKELWDSLEFKYMAEDSSSKKFLDFKHTLKYGKDNLSLVKLGSHLRIEESLRVQDSDKGKGKEVGGPSVNMTEEGGHVYYKRMLEMSKDDLIPAIDENLEKCITCMLTKITRKPFQSITRKYVILELIHSDLCDFHATPSLGNKKYVITFIDDAYRPIVRLPDPKHKTLDEKGIDCIFVGYAEHSKAYRDDLSDDVPNKIEPRKEAIDDEIGSIMKYNTWVLSDLLLGCKWIFKRKMKVAGTVDKFKARLVIQDFTQKEGIDYFETYAPVARITTIILLLALAAIHNLVIHQMDVKTTFLNGDLEEEVYIKQPKGFVMSGNEHKVCKKFDDSVKGVIICVYVDDMLIFGTNQNQVDKTKKFLSSRFSMKDMREADVILGIKIKHENKRILITQSHYIEKIIKKFNREDCSPVSTPMDPVEKLKLNTGLPDDQLKYSRAIGCLMYAMISTRPNIAYVIGRLKGYTNASWINQVEDSYFRSGWVFLFGGGAISWASKKQTCITGSTMEFEFLAFAAGKEAEWIRNLIHEILI